MTDSPWLLAGYLEDIRVLTSDRCEVPHIIADRLDRDATVLARTVDLDPQAVFDAINSALVDEGVWTEEAVKRADEAKYVAARAAGRHLRGAAESYLHQAGWLAAEETVGHCRVNGWSRLGPIVESIIDQLETLSALAGQEAST